MQNDGHSRQAQGVSMMLAAASALVVAPLKLMFLVLRTKCTLAGVAAGPVTGEQGNADTQEKR